MKREHRINKFRHRKVSLLMATLMVLMLFTGCGKQNIEEEPNDKVSSENIMITETGEVLEMGGEEQAEVTEEPKQGAEAVTELSAESSESPEVIMMEEHIKESEKELEVTEENQTEATDKDMQLVFLGDSIFDADRDGTGVPYLTSVQCDADVYNLAIGGTSASVELDADLGWENWNSMSLPGVVYAMEGRISTDIFEGTNMKELIDNPDIDFSQTDYFIIEYGMNDFFMGAPIKTGDHEYNLKSYVGSLRFAVSSLRSMAPDATIVLCAPNYARFFKGDWMYGDGNTVNTGYGTLFDYKGACESVANEMNTLFLNAYNGLGIDGYTAEQYLEDGIHLTAEGRQLYADALARLILSYEETKNN